MIRIMREKFGPKVIGGIIALIAFVFIFYGIFMPGRGSGASGPGVAGEVNGEAISYSEFSHALNQRIDFFKNLMGGKVNEEQMEQFHIREAVFQDLAQRKILVQIARKEGFYPSSEQIREQIVGMEVFKKDGRFDKVLYKNVLSQNQYTPTRFEELVGQDIMEQNFRTFVGSLAFVTADDVEKDLKATKEKNKFKYVYLDNESVRKSLPKNLKPEEQSKKLNEQVESLTKAVLPLLSANQDAKVNALLKDTGVKVKTSEWLTSQSETIPGVGSIRSIQADIFGSKKGEPAKRYALMGGSFIALVVDHEGYDASKITPKERNEVLARLQNQKQSELTQDMIKAWMKKATITRNDAVVVGGKGSSVPVGMDN